MTSAPSQGFPIVLTADRTLTAGYHLLFDGMLAASQTTVGAPPPLLSWLLMPRAGGPANGLRSPLAPLGLRRIEAALLAGGFASDEVIVADDSHLDRAIGRSTRIIGVSTGEPAGLGMNSSTMVAVCGGTSYPQAMFQRLMHQVGRCRRRAPHANVVLGGPGAWQLAGKPAERRKLGIDHIVVGYSEDGAADIFRSIARNAKVEPVLTGGWREGATIPPIRGASTMGVIEISRGCGWGCGFCTIGRAPMVHLPRETILADARMNVAAGQACIAALSEDFFRFGASGMRARAGAVIELLRELRSIPGVRMIQIDHANLASVAQFTDEDLSEARLLLSGQPDRLVWLNVGVESAAGELLKRAGGGAKMRGCRPEEWGDFAAYQIERLCRAGYFPLVSLIVGLPGESESDLRRTMEWVRRLPDRRLAVFPLIHAPIDGSALPSTGRAAWELIRACYEINFRTVPGMYWDNQLGAGIGVGRRSLMQAMGLGQVLQWKALLAWRIARSRR